MKALSKKELAALYGISSATLLRKLKEIPYLNTGKRNILFPNELKMVYECLGEPDI
jgi:hypothetical protein